MSGGVVRGGGVEFRLAVGWCCAVVGVRLVGRGRRGNFGDRDRGGGLVLVRSLEKARDYYALFREGVRGLVSFVLRFRCVLGWGMFRNWGFSVFFGR